ncbi:hypothetical protein PENTCL1PPCAC_17988 [Pristionchus entomophagus]|uniref:Uncharacterized protein n=1 Tax=Pristionchus entomophagus TaxID=358040 RepID=A0AAV5TNK2_9BILA|nr:hypothetical protein PENTCL1PPCAC_17988 [Pristionchus entomophagus]
MNGPIRMKINLTAGSSHINGSSEFDEPDLSLNGMDDDGVQVLDKDDSSRSHSSSRPASNESAQSSKGESRPGSSADIGDGLLKFTLPTTKSRKRKHVKTAFDVGAEKVDEQTALLRQLEKERLAENEKRRVAKDDNFANMINASCPRQFDVVEIDEEVEECKPSTSKTEKKEEYEVIDISSGEEDNWGGTPRRVAPPRYNFSFADLRRRGNVSAAERKQQEEAQSIERRRLKGKNLDYSEKDQILNREGGLLVNPGHPSNEEDIFVAPHLTHILQPHQLNGVIFLYENVIVSKEDYQKNKNEGGFGCILAHSMGLGKTLQIITMCDVFFRATKSHKILILCPINVIQNWYNEFGKWFPAYDERGEELRKFNVYLFGDSIKTFDQRVNLIEEWSDNGGVLLMGYEMFRLLNKNNKGQKPKKTRPRIEFVGGRRVEEEKEQKMEKKKIEDAMTPAGRLTKEANDIISAALIDPGPDLVVCDEGHMIKNVTADISITLSTIKTKRRIILTGYPLQNNLMEYYCMVNFVRPDYLGSKKNFANQFEKPIKNGQCVDSTPHDIKIARQRTHVLIDQLKGFVQRRTQHILKQVLPDSREYVLLMRKSPIQHVLYRSFVANTMAEIRDGSGSTFNPLKAFAMCSKFWNHPDVLYKCLMELRQLKDEKERKEKEKRESIIIQKKKDTLFFAPFAPFEGGGMVYGQHQSQWMGGPPPPPTGFSPFSYLDTPMVNGMNPHMNGGMNGMNGMMGMGMGGMTPQFSPFQPFGSDSSASASRSSSRINSSPHKKKKDTLASVLADELDLDPSIKYDWAEMAMRGYMPGRVEDSPKMKYALSLIDGCTRRGEKIILFSQSLSTLSLIEEALDNIPLVTPMGQRMWNKNINYLRFDGSTNGAEREKLINRFNGDCNIYLFLISTKAGSLGVNLVSASRCIIFDACWNPCHDAQAVCRIYRYGQQQRTFIYRLVMDNSMEKAIFNRQISKNGLQQRVVDEQQVDANVTQKELESLLVYDESLDVIDRPHNVSRWNIEDDILKEVVMRENRLLSQEPFLHESLLLESQEGLSEEEKKEALALYHREKAVDDLGIPLNLESGRSYGRDPRDVIPNIYNGLSMVNSHGYIPPPLRSTPVPMSLSSSYPHNGGIASSIPGGATLGSFVKLNSYQKPPPIMGAPTNPSFLAPQNGVGTSSTKTSILLPDDAHLPVYGDPSKVVLVAKSTPAVLFDCGPNHKYLSLQKGPLLDARGIDLSSVIPSISSQSTQVSRPSNFIPDVIELD